mmetsp:Transcript_63070/g.133143  ORF Transcript_63070/g.133143 Transcript_63070/m.133143 type:complete len:122 (-) Transcript_63070:240-605(-)|eukprot:CAMPEP_0206465582 /NCGR_PEP_ID=MMETSP0324_2-20121206/27923_1 /ASSEMBLY_ACC=CAM_ASM_000836 /TAXON_ID=2866 /ORGANISM="Crypthecodinium cohnii, Strain Seligo" /LENGTH=121 /DNA_ID=CAMNT_0053938483 /DNA_START=139 /DNA_END=504 /DNA_ORIENTATION=-
MGAVAGQCCNHSIKEVVEGQRDSAPEERSHASGEDSPRGGLRAAAESGKKAFQWRGRQDSVYKVEGLNTAELFAAEPDAHKLHFSSDTKLANGRKVDRKATGYAKPDPSLLAELAEDDDEE